MIAKLDQWLQWLEDRQCARKTKQKERTKDNPKSVYKWVFIYQICRLLFVLLKVCLYFVSTLTLTVVTVFGMNKYTQNINTAILVTNDILNMLTYLCMMYFFGSFLKQIYHYMKFEILNIKTIVWKLCQYMYISIMIPVIQSIVIIIDFEKLEQLRISSIPDYMAETILFGILTGVLVVLWLKQYSFNRVILFLDDWWDKTNDGLEKEANNTIQVISRRTTNYRTGTCNACIYFSVGYTTKNNYFIPFLSSELYH